MHLEVTRSQDDNPSQQPFTLTAAVTFTPEEQKLFDRYLLPAEHNDLRKYPKLTEPGGITIHATDVYALEKIEEDIKTQCDALADYMKAAQKYGGVETFSFDMGTDDFYE